VRLCSTSCPPLTDMQSFTAGFSLAPSSTSGCAFSEPYCSGALHPRFLTLSFASTAYLTIPYSGWSQLYRPCELFSTIIFKDSLRCPHSIFPFGPLINVKWLMLLETSSRRRLSYTPYKKCIRCVKWR